MARVEGEGGLSLRIRDDRLEEVTLRIFEPPRFFEALLRGRRLEEAPDITARICGICPVAYQISSVTAMEKALGIQVGGCLRELRRLIYCGEWIESHCLHLHLLHAPDFLGFDDSIQLARKFPAEVERGLRLKKLGNRLMAAVGGREVHPINMRVGGFYSLPSRSDLLALRDDLRKGLDESIEVVRWVSKLSFPDFEPETEFVAMQHPTEYPLFEGAIVSNRGLSIPIEQYEEAFVEVQEEHSTSLHSKRRTTGCYQVGPVARFNLNRDRLTPMAKQVAEEVGLGGQVLNPFKSIIVRAVETVFAFEEAVRIIEAYEPSSEPFVPYLVHAGEGCGCSEAPRGICYHKYRFDENGIIQSARIVPPTSQNLARIEQDLREYVPPRMHLTDERLRWECEQAIRNYDPCISCSVHFLKLEVDRA
jgi:coenzyme F420-reducing hydrogenase alpha subunit